MGPRMKSVQGVKPSPQEATMSSTGQDVRGGGDNPIKQRNAALSALGGGGIPIPNTGIPRQDSLRAAPKGESHRRKMFSKNNLI